MVPIVLRMTAELMLVVVRLGRVYLLRGERPAISAAEKGEFWVFDLVVKAAMPVPSECETVSEPRSRRSRICVSRLVRDNVEQGVWMTYQTTGKHGAQHDA